MGVVSGRGELVGKFNWQDIQSVDRAAGDPIPVHVEDIKLSDLFYSVSQTISYCIKYFSEHTHNIIKVFLFKILMASYVE